MTRILRGLPKPLSGERLLGVHPTIAPQPDASWRARAHFFIGRAVTPSALQTEQAERGGRLSISGQVIAPGVVAGLEVSLEERDGIWTVEVSPGVGLTAFGEDVRLVRPLRVPLHDLELTLTRGGATETLRVGQWLGLQTPPAPDAPIEPLVFVLLLEPIELQRAGEVDPTDPCELAPEEIAFDDEQRVDGVRLCAVEIPAGFPLPTPAPSPDTWRNRLAYAIFEHEAALPGPSVMPWEGTGLGVALVGIASASAAPLLDVHAVARDGGQLNRRRPFVGSSATRRLWQARVRQFTTQLSDVDLTALAVDGLASRFRFLPPVGTLPRAVMRPGPAGVIPLDVRGDRGEPHFPLPPSPLLPPSWVVEAAPVELEALDDLLRAAAPTGPLDLTAPEQIQILVPVPQRHFSPDLLRVEDETPDEFREAIRLFLLRLNHRLGRRNDVRGGEERLQPVLFGSDPEHPAVDPGAVAGEATSRFPQDDDLPDGEIVPPPEPRFADDARPELIELGETMARLVSANPFARFVEQLRAESVNELPGPVPFVTPSEAGQRFANSNAGGQGLTGFVQETSKKLLAASEALDISFTRTANELFRIRSLVSGEVEATQLATSPAIPFVVKNRLTAVTPTQIAQFRTFLQTDRPSTPPDPDAPSRVESKSSRIPGADGVPAAIVFTRDVRARLEAPLVLDARDGAERAKRAVFSTLLAIDAAGLSLTELEFPGFLVPPGTDLNGDPPTEIPGTPEEDLERVSVPVRWVRRFLEFYATAGYWPHDRSVGGEDESSFAATAIRSVEETIAALRVAEARLAAFDRALTLAREHMNEQLAVWAALQRRLAELEDEISEFRHDVRVARALEREEIARARRINAERRQILDEHVPFLVFRRPRTLDGLQGSPAHPAAPAVVPDAVPACLRGDFEAPDALRAMVDLLREAPLAWTTFGAALLARVNRHLALRQLAAVALHRAANPAPTSYDPFASSAFTDATGQRIREIADGQRRALAELRGQRLRFGVPHYLRFSWLALQLELLPVATLNDLVLTSHGRQEVSDRLARHLNDINRVVACLFEHLRQVPPFVRLQWVELLSEIQGSVAMRQLSRLPDWETIDPSDQRDLQRFVDWLYQQLASEIPEARSFMDDLVRVTILLASHAPVHQTLAAPPVNVRPVVAGGVLELSLDAERTRVGMQVLLYETEGPVPAVAQGVVEDLSDGVARVRVALTENDRSVVPVRAQLVEPDRSPGVALATGEQVGVGKVSSSP